MPGKKILLYYPDDKRSVAIETLCIAVHEAGNEIIVLTLRERGPLLEALGKSGIKTYIHFLERKRALKYFVSHARYLIRFSKQHRIDIVWSHLQEGNIIAVLAQPFMKAKLITFRHHAESAFYAEFGNKFGMKRNRREAFLDKIINRFARTIVVPSSGVWYGMEKYEKCKMTKVKLIPYIYDFTTYQQPDPAKVKTLRNHYACHLLLIMVSRMIVSKQHMPVFEVVRKLADEGLSVKIIVMDEGSLRSQLEEFIKINKLNDHIFLTGFQEDFVNYMAAADLLMHPSVTEASSNVVKEMGLLKKGVAVCEHVGDFDDYIKDMENGYILQPSSLNASIERVIRDAYSRKEALDTMGEKLNQAVFQRFSDSQENRSRFLKLI